MYIRRHHRCPAEGQDKIVVREKNHVCMKVIAHYLLFAAIAAVLYGIVYAACRYYDKETYACWLTDNYEAQLVGNDDGDDAPRVGNTSMTISLDTNFIYVSRRPIEIPFTTTLDSQMIRIDRDAPVALLSGDSLMSFLANDYPSGTKESWHKRFIKRYLRPHIFQRDSWKAGELGIWFCIVPLLFLVVLGSFRKEKSIDDVDTNISLGAFSGLITVPTLLWAVTGLGSSYDYYHQHNILLTIGLIVVGLAFLFYMLVASVGSITSVMALNGIRLGLRAWLGIIGCSFLGGLLFWFCIGVPNGMDGKSAESAILVLLGMFIGGALWASYKMIRQNRAVVRYLPEFFICVLFALFAICITSVVAIAYLLFKSFVTAPSSPDDHDEEWDYEASVGTDVLKMRDMGNGYLRGENGKTYHNLGDGTVREV